MPRDHDGAKPSRTYTITCGTAPTIKVYELETGNRRVTLPDGTFVVLTPGEYRFFHMMVKESADELRPRSFSLSVILEQVWPKHPGVGATGRNLIYATVAALRRRQILCIENNRGAYSIAGRVKATAALDEGRDEVPAPRLDPELTFYNMIVAVLMTAMITTAVTALIRGLLTQARLTITQAPEFGFLLGLLQGVAGALIWSLPLATLFLHRWFRAGETYATWSRDLERPWAAARMLALGAAAGFAGGLAVDALIMFAQQPVSLQQAGWTRVGDTNPWTVFTVTRLGWAEPALGAVVCLACMATLLAILRLPRWHALLEQQRPYLDLRRMASMLLLVCRRFGLWPLVWVTGPVLAASATLYFVYHGQLTLGRFMGEGAIIAAAGFLFVNSMLFAMLFEAQGVRATAFPSGADPAEVIDTRTQLLGSRPEAVLALLKARAAAPLGQRRDGRKLGLIVEGGGMRGVLSAGSLFALELGGYRACFDAVFALSAGSVNSAYFLSGQGALGITVYFDDISNRRFFNPLRFWKMADVDYVYDTVVKEVKPLDESELRRCPQEFFITATDVAAGKNVLLNVKDPKVPVTQSLKASSALPILYNRSVEVSGTQYMDGGISGGLPVVLSMEHGCTDLVVLLSRPCSKETLPASRLERWAFWLLLGSRQRQLYGAFLGAYTRKVENRDLAMGRVTVPEVNVACICPDDANSSVGRMTTKRSELIDGALQCALTTARLLGIDSASIEKAFQPFDPT